MHCQKCRSPLKVDSSLEDLNPAAFDLLVGESNLPFPHTFWIAQVAEEPLSPSLRLGSAGSPPQKSPKSQIRPRPIYPHGRKDMYDQATRHAQSPVFKRTITTQQRFPSTAPHAQPRASSPKRAGRDNSAMSFVMLTDSQVVPQSHSRAPERQRPISTDRPQETSEVSVDDGDQHRVSLSHQMDTANRLFEVLSSRSDIDHPICAECTELLAEGLQKRLGNTARERDAYVEFLKKLNTEVPTEEERKKAEHDLRSTKRKEATSFAELQALEREKAAVDEEIAALEEEALQLDIEEEKFWRERNAFALTLSSFQNERDGINLQYDHDSRQLERLQRTNVYNDTFCIGHDGFFGTINGLRLGRLANQPVEWSEINAAWGQTLLLLATVADKLGFTFEGYRLKPMGSTSRIERLEYLPSSTTSNAQHQTTQPKTTIFELFSSGNLPLGFLHRRFDNAMVAFLECLRQLGDFVEHDPAGGRVDHQSGLKLPYEIRKDRIGDASIKLGFNQDEAWTRACKYTLTCCKFLLAHASNVGGSGRRATG
ncbi:MAG: autophagy protein 6 [Trichoglossum hirsutum]|nr:MAG: autophagy protein 6 [Trichoglossum hirsutum]